MEKPLVLYDGVCRLCNATVQFLAPRDPQGNLRFESLQSQIGQKMLRECGLSVTQLDTFVLMEEGRCYTYSTAVLRLARYLRFPWPIVTVFLLVPRFIRDAVYRWIARNRYDWFGRLDG